jgi:DNA processing protein
MSQSLDDERYARAALTYLAEPGDPWLAALVRECGAARALAAIRAGRFPAGRRRDTAERAMARWRLRLAGVPEPDEVADQLARGIRLVIASDAEWPDGLAELGDNQPYAIWLRGAATDLGALCRRSVAIVGSRAATAYGSYIAAELAASITARGWTVVSGGAYGIDGCAHRGALAARGPTVAVMAGGVDRLYPVGHKELLDGVVVAGAVISEWPPGQGVARLRFLVRNRVIAAITRGCLVVEAGRRSGALNTARHARDLGRPLMAVPGPVTSDLSAGCHSIIRDWQGTLVTTVDEVVETLDHIGGAQAGIGDAAGLIGTGDGVPRPPSRDPATMPFGVPTARSPRDRPAWGDLARDALDHEAATVLDALPTRGALSTSDIAARAGLEPPTVLARLAVLAVFGFAERTERGWRARPAGNATASGSTTIRLKHAPGWSSPAGLGRHCAHGNAKGAFGWCGLPGGQPGPGREPGGAAAFAPQHGTGRVQASPGRGTRPLQAHGPRLLRRRTVAP